MADKKFDGETETGGTFGVYGDSGTKLLHRFTSEGAANEARATLLAEDSTQQLEVKKIDEAATPSSTFKPTGGGGGGNASSPTAFVPGEKISFH
jgi:hypothetical protein